MADLALNGALLILPDAPARLTLRIQDGYIASIGGSPRPGDKVLDLTGYTIFPGFINAYDDLQMDVFPRVKMRNSYEDIGEWQLDIEEQLRTSDMADLMGVPIQDRLLVGGTKNLLSGATTVINVGEGHRFLSHKNFPVRVVESEFDIGWDVDSLGERSHLAYGYQLTEASIGDLVGLIWCPETNHFLFGDAAYHPEMLGRIALGTASRLSGSLDLLEELKRADLSSDLTARRLLQLVMGDGASLMGIANAGRLARDSFADLVVVAAQGNDPYQSIIDSHRADLRLVVVGGKPRIGSLDMEGFFKATRTAYKAVSLDGVPKLIARDLFKLLRRSNLIEPGLRI